MKPISAVLMLLLFAGCASITPMATLEQYEQEKNYPGIISALGEYVGGNEEGEKMQKKAWGIILNNKNESKKFVIDALNNGKGSLRDGAAEIASKWSDRDFKNPLFKALADSTTFGNSALTRQKVGYAFGSLDTVLDQNEKKETAIKITATFEGENDVAVLLACVTSLTKFAVPETNASLLALDSAIFQKKEKTLTLLGGRANRTYLILLKSQLNKAIAATAVKK